MLFYIFHCIFFSGFIFKPLLYSLALRLFVIPSVRSHIQNLKMSLESFDRELERKRSCLEFSLKNSKHCETGLKPNKRKLIIPARFFFLTVDFQRHFTLNILVFVNNSCFVSKCFIESYLLSWLFIKISFLSLCWLFSVVPEHPMQEYSKWHAYMYQMVLKIMVL